MPLKLIAEGNGCRLYHGNAWEHEGDDIDLVLTNPYGALPSQALGKPMILSHSADRASFVEGVAQASLTGIGLWHRGTQAVWAANMEAARLDLDFLAAEEVEPMRGFWPLDLPLRLLMHCGYDYRDERLAYCSSPVVADPYMGRGTVGKACQLLGLHFVGIDIDLDRVMLAKRYLGL